MLKTTENLIFSVVFYGERFVCMSFFIVESMYLILYKTSLEVHKIYENVYILINAFERIDKEYIL